MMHFLLTVALKPGLSATGQFYQPQQIAPAASEEGSQPAHPTYMLESFVKFPSSGGMLPVKLQP